MDSKVETLDAKVEDIVGENRSLREENVKLKEDLALFDVRLDNLEQENSNRYIMIDVGDTRFHPQLSDRENVVKLLSEDLNINGKALKNFPLYRMGTENKFLMEANKEVKTFILKEARVQKPSSFYVNEFLSKKRSKTVL